MLPVMDGPGGVGNVSHIIPSSRLPAGMMAGVLGWEGHGGAPPVDDPKAPVCL